MVQYLLIKQWLNMFIVYKYFLILQLVCVKMMWCVCFSEVDEKVNLMWNDNATVTYEKMRRWYFDRENSAGDLTDLVTTLNAVALVIIQPIYMQILPYLSVSFSFIFPYFFLIRLKNYITIENELYYITNNKITPHIKYKIKTTVWAMVLHFLG